LRSREYLPAEDFNRLAQAALEKIEEEEPAGGRARVLLSGIVPEPMEILDLLSGAGASVVADDTAACARRLPGHGESPSPYRRMAERIAGAPACSTRGARVEDRAELLGRLAEDSGAKGVLFLGVKFCEPELFYLPALRRALEKRGLRSLVLELDPLLPLAHQATTRLEAFVEMLS
ncbi:MAG: 2-hydroxyacyl-CoA dehydratase, partial [Myxococcota bacterium]